METNGASHENIVMSADNGTIGTVGFDFVLQVFVDTLFVTLYIKPLTNDADKRGNYHRFGCDVRVESIFPWHALANLIFRLAAVVEVGI